MSFEKVFNITPDGDIELSPIAKQIPEYKEIIIHSPRVDRDSDGRKKTWAKQVFLYIYHFVDPRSQCKNLSAIERRKKALELAGCKPDFKDSGLVVAAMARYKQDLPLDATANAYFASEKALYSVSEDIKWMLENTNNVKEILRGNLTRLNQENTIKVEDTGLIKEIIVLMKELSSTEKDIASVIKELPTMKKVLDELAAKYAEQGGGKQKVHGGGELGNRED
jgi:ribosomal protein L17